MKSFLHTTHRNIHWLKMIHDSGELDMKPPFQRNPVWVNRQKSFLIDTILNGFPIPEIYMQDNIDSNGKAKYIVVDGQQRLRACLDFLDSQFSIDPKDSPNWADLNFEDLSQEEKQKIYQYEFVVRLLPQMTDIEIREIFQRLNRNVVALNKQELRQATYWGEFITCMNAISDKETWAGFDLFTPNDIRRMLDVEYISELAIAIIHGVQNKKLSLDKFYEIYENEFEWKDEIPKVFDSVLGELIQILPDFRKTRWNKKADFYTLFTVFSKHHGKLPLSSNKRSKAATLLVKFASDMDVFVSSEREIHKKLPSNVLAYGSGIRASTDLGSRKKREDALEKELKEVWKK
jgi:uncharacterized protein with ParB-like and HNH nuclease domain